MPIISIIAAVVLIIAGTILITKSFIQGAENKVDVLAGFFLIFISIYMISTVIKQEWGGGFLPSLF